jgi:hypothetical protein
VRSGARVPRFSAWPGAAVQRCAASDAVPWPDAVAAEPDGTPVRRAAPLPEAVRGGPSQEAAQDEPWQEAARGGPSQEAAQDEPWQEAAQGGPWRAAVQDEPWRAAVPRVGLRPQAVRALYAPGQMNSHSPRPPKCREEML